MKNIQFLIIIFLLIAGISCSKDNIPGNKEALGSVGSYLTLQEPTKVVIDFANRNTESASIKVGSHGAQVQSVNIYTGEPSDSLSWIFIKNVPFTDGVELTITAAELAAALGISIDSFTLGSSFDIINEIITTDGRKFSVKNTATDFEDKAGYSMAMRWTINIVCPFLGNMAGNYKVIQDDWHDFDPGTIIDGAVEDGPGPNQISLHVYPNPGIGIPVNPIIVNIDPASGAATVPAVEYGDYGVLISAKGSGFVFSCTKTINLTLEHFEDLGSYGLNTLVLQKQD